MGRVGRIGWREGGRKSAGGRVRKREGWRAIEEGARKGEKGGGFSGRLVGGTGELARFQSVLRR